MTYEGGHTLHTDELPWLPLAPKVKIRLLRLDRDSGEFSVMIRAEAGGVLPRHKHLAGAEIFILEGEGRHPQTGDFRRGDYIIEPDQAVHDPLDFEQDVTMIMMCKGASAFLAPDDSVAFLMDVPMLEGLAAAHAGRA